MTTIAALSKNGRNIVPTVVQALESLKLKDGHFVLASPSVLHETENAQTLREQDFCSSVAIGCVFPETSTRNAPKFRRMGNAVSLFEGRLYFPPDMDSRNLLLDRQPRVNREKAILNFLKEAEGDFSLTIAEPERILAARDPVGVQPFYYGETTDIAALASNRTALWRLGISKPCSFPPGNMASVSREGFSFKPVKAFTRFQQRQITLDEAARVLRGLLEQSVQARVNGVEEVAVAFSGGLDSSVAAFLARKSGVKVRLVHVSLRGQPETEEAKKTAGELELPLSVYFFEAEDVERTVAKVVQLVEEPDPLKAAVGVPFFWVAEKTAESGLDVLLAGQGADELFGGYQRYVNEYLSHGKSKLRETMFCDVVRLHETNIERDEKICGFHSVELRLPFASYSVVEFALSLPVELKVEKKLDGLRKLVLRKVAQDLELPEAVVNKPKKAVQYATGVNAVLGKIAKKQGLTVGAYVKRLFREVRG
jgi:asparagine synthase (glutamine-hydrolysing)